MTKPYFANDEAKVIAERMERSAVQKRIPEYLREAIEQNLNMYYSNLNESDYQDDSYVDVKVNEARSLTRQFLSLITKSRLAFEVSADTTETTTLSQSKITSALIDEVIQKHKLDLLAEKMTECAYLQGIGFLYARWNVYGGREYSLGPQREIITTGELDISAPDFDDVFFDYSVPWDEQNWVVVRTRQNKHDLAALHSEMSDAILKADNINALTRQENSLSLGAPDEQEDFVWVYEFYHKLTPAVPKGRYVKYIEPDLVLDDGKNPYQEIPIIAMTPEPIEDTGLGYPMFSNLVPVQQMLDVTVSTIATNHSAFGIQSIMVAEGSDLSPSELSQGLQILYFKPQPGVAGNGAPQPLQLTQTPAEVFNAIGLYESFLGKQSGINSTLRGSPPPGVTAAQAIIALSTNAIESSQSFAKTYNIALESLMQIVLRIYRRFATAPQLVPIVGKHNQYQMKEFMGKDLPTTSLITIKATNPITKTAAGRLQLADTLLQSGLIKSPGKYLQLIDNGSYETLYESEAQELLSIQAENEELLSGEKVMALSIDDHPQHIMEHKSILTNPALRRLASQYKQGMQNPEDIEEAYIIVSNTLFHIEEHQRLEADTDPALKAMATTGRAPQLQGPQ